MKANTYPNSCTLIAVSLLTDIPDRVIVNAFKKTDCYGEDRGTYLETIKDSLDLLGISYQDHVTNQSSYIQAMSKQGYIFNPTPLRSVLNDFNKGNHIVLVYEGPTEEFHTIAVGSGCYMGIRLNIIDSSYYIGHFTINSVSFKWKELLTHREKELNYG